jgi:multicomponent Na+:H+ antiporter subunit G
MDLSLITQIIIGVFLFLGCFLVVVASIGIVRFPDFYSRLHPAGKTDSMGQALVLISLIIYEGFTLATIKMIIIILFIFIANPTATHALANAAHAGGVKPWKKGDKRR